MSELDPERGLTQGDTIPVVWQAKDIVGAILGVKVGEISPEEFYRLPQYNIFEVTRSQVDQFCGPCDRYQSEDGGCNLFYGKENQPRYVARQWCGWATVKGLRGQMTEEGFTPASTTPPEAA